MHHGLHPSGHISWNSISTRVGNQLNTNNPFSKPIPSVLITKTETGAFEHSNMTSIVPTEKT
jgi:hypothetical protein